MRSRRGVVGFLAAVAAVTLGTASAAWACTVFANVVGVSPAQTTENSVVRVAGEGLAPAGRAVELRWDGASGPVLASAPVDAKGHFAADVTIPSAGAGFHSVVAVPTGPGVAGMGRAAVQVMPATVDKSGSASAASSLDPWAAGAKSAQSSNGSAGSSLPGAGLLGGGLLVLFAGVTAVAVNRRRAAAGSR